MSELAHSKTDALPLGKESSRRSSLPLKYERA